MKGEGMDKVREALARIVNTYDAYRRRGVSPAPAEYADVVAAIDAAREALSSQPAEPVELGDRFMEILRAIHGDMPDDFADSARLAFVHATKVTQPAPSVPAVPEALLRYLRDTSQEGSVAEKIVANTALQLLAAAPHPAAKGGAE